MGGQQDRRGLLAVLVVMVVLLTGTACATTIAGTPRAAPGIGSADPGEGPTSQAPSGEPAPEDGTADEDLLVSGVLENECLLSKADFEALLGQPVLEPEQITATEGGVVTSSSCFTHQTTGFPVPIGAINVFGVRAGSPEQAVRDALATGGGRRELPGVGEVAMLLEEADGATLYVASDRFLVAIAALEQAPDEPAWAAAGTAAVAALPR